MAFIILKSVASIKAVKSHMEVMSPHQRVLVMNIHIANSETIEYAVP